MSARGQEFGKGVRWVSATSYSLEAAKYSLGGNPQVLPNPALGLIICLVKTLLTAESGVPDSVTQYLPSRRHSTQSPKGPWNKMEAESLDNTWLMQHQGLRSLGKEIESISLKMILEEKLCKGEKQVKTAGFSHLESCSRGWDRHPSGGVPTNQQDWGKRTLRTSGHIIRTGMGLWGIYLPLCNAGVLPLPLAR